MADIVVPADDRPSLAKYTLFAVVGVVVLNAFVASFTSGASNPAVQLVGVLVAGAGSILVLLLLVQSLVGEWFDAATIVDG